ncbi:prolyl oligopeptidase family serine peptidase [Muricauda sp. JGD-17]|uniref:Prolyl oligopeptidase family serine peptidase n=1 Tax=Flagellimonas ochracea TaxID=2696472 RepID=A0A964TFS8_9FLAO|nr:prolyl oligopeptidase family serine peptidase [Allomuricauda ochracea]NAY93136.1 prolyl oligopeptidase family serine peptidase [Allomuricauda ochracea]
MKINFHIILQSLAFILMGFNYNSQEKTSYRERHVTITSKDNFKQHGVLYTPQNSGKLTPAIVVGHGSAPSTYEDVGYYTYLAQKLGFVVLAYDKRGVGESKGIYRRFNLSESQESFDLLSNDMSLWVDFLARQQGVDSNNIGLLGGSQAGWIMPFTAYKNNKVKFIISGEGTPLSAGEEQYFSELTDDRLDGPMSIKEADAKMSEFNGPKGFDPRDILKKIDVPILWIFGTSDPVIPVDASIRELKTMEHPKHEIVVLKNGNHDFVNVETGVSYNLLEYIGPWLAKIGVSK